MKLLSGWGLMKPTTLLCYAGAVDVHGGYGLAADDDARPAAHYTGGT